MTEKTKSIIAFFGMLIALILLVAWDTPGSQTEQPSLRFKPSIPKLEYSPLRTGSLEVAKVFGRTSGCESADAEFIEQTNHAAVRAGLDPRIAAATIAVESGCNNFAISSRGALGLMQVMPKIWKNQYDFEGRVNLLNRQDNLRVGTEILAGLIAQYGVPEGIKRYQGLGQNCETCDGAYPSKILNLAGRK
jgi:hypothetical protein